jgi:hypothetical protein
MYDWILQQDFGKDLSDLANHRLVQPKRLNITKAIRKIDAPKRCPDMEDKVFKYSIFCTDMYLSDVLTSAWGDPGEFNVASSPGLTYKKKGVKTKEEALDNDLFIERFKNFATPLWENCGKVEFLPLQEILDNKIRTFKVSEFDFAVRQKILYDQQNTRFLERSKQGNFWARYGFSKEYGGFDRLVKELQGLSLIWMSDVSGWDRNLPVMEICYLLRHKYLKNCPKWAKWVAEHTVHSLEVDEEGIVFRNHSGNRSGSMNTTVDNCICHILILMYALVKIFYVKYSKFPSIHLLRKQRINVMGDDNFSGVTEEFSLPKNEFEEVITNIYAEFGLVLKKGSVLVSTDTVTIDPNFEFLGCKVGYDNNYGRYVPVPRIHKVASTILYSEKNIPINIYVQRVIGLSHICYGVDFLMKCLVKIMKELLKKHNIEEHFREEMRSILSMAKQPYYRVLGFENRPAGLSFFQGGGRGKTSMLTKQQFKAKHAAKFAKQGLTKAQIDMRYKDYRNTYVPSRKEYQYMASKGKSTRASAMNRNEQLLNVPVLSSCSRMYLRALTNPFGVFDHLPCIPDVICIPSNKYSAKCRGTLTVGSGQVGWISVDPFMGAINDKPAVYHTNGPYALTNFNPGAPGTSSDSSDSPYTYADLAPNCQVRTVGCGVKVRFQGSEFQRGGNVILYRQPYNAAIVSGVTDTDLLKDRTSSQTPATRKWECVCFRPTSFNELQYSELPGATTNGSLLIYISGATPGQSWSFEVIWYFELIGNRAEKTASHSDPNGMSAITQALSQSPVLSSPPNKQEIAAVASTTEALKQQSGWQSMLLEAGKGVASGLASLAGGPLGGIASTLLLEGTQMLAERNMPALPSVQSVRIDEID